jgi:hypothetical protein
MEGQGEDKIERRWVKRAVKRSSSPQGTSAIPTLSPLLAQPNDAMACVRVSSFIPFLLFHRQASQVHVLQICSEFIRARQKARLKLSNFSSPRVPTLTYHIISPHIN